MKFRIKTNSRWLETGSEVMFSVFDELWGMKHTGKLMTFLLNFDHFPLISLGRGFNRKSSRKLSNVQSQKLKISFSEWNKWKMKKKCGKVMILPIHFFKNEEYDFRARSQPHENFTFHRKCLTTFNGHCVLLGAIKKIKKFLRQVLKI